MIDQQAVAKPCAQSFGSDGTLCATHGGTFASDAAPRCTARLLGTRPHDHTVSECPYPCDILAGTPEPLPREAPCSSCGSDWHYTDECGDLMAGAALASAIVAAYDHTIDGEDVERIIGELGKRGYRLTRNTPEGTAISPLGLGA